MSLRRVSVVIVGAGPAGFYAASALLQRNLGCQIDIIDYLPTPYGLIRAGVAPDHQTTKKVVRAFEKIALNESCQFFGNVQLGRDVSVEELRELYDVVILAVGAGADRTLEIPGGDRPGVIGSATFVGWYNAHPDFVDLNPNLNTQNVVIIGNGNVAIDVARVLVKTKNEMAESDIPGYAADAIENSPITDVYMLGRRGPVQAKFTNVELREMGELEEAISLVDPDQLPADVGATDSDRDRRVKEKNLATLRSFCSNKSSDSEKRVHFGFWSIPKRILGSAHAEGIQMERTALKDGRVVGTGETFEIQTSLVIPAIGYRSVPMEGLPFDHDNDVVRNSDGRVMEGVYAVGWIKRGPSGVISTNRPDGALVAEYVASDFPKGGRKSGRERLDMLLKQRKIDYVDFGGWKRIEEAEIAAACERAPRRKFETIAEMLAVAGGKPAD